jgi:hypothetical protein
VEILMVILVVTALVGALVWHHHTKAVAMAGIEFSVAESPDRVAHAISNTYCLGTKAAVKRALSRVTVRQTGPTSFQVSTRLGDMGSVDQHHHGARPHR